MNGDGMVDMTDVIQLLRHVGNPATHPIYNETKADLNHDSVVNMGDVILLLNHVNDPVGYDLLC